ncbi:MAG: hypothetical protein AAFO69_07855 [Bacteroidota bacterium]
MKKQLLYYTAYTLMIVGGCVIAKELTSKIHDAYLQVMVFFYLQSIFIAYLHYLGIKDTQKLAIYFLGGTVFRLLTILLMLAVIYIANVPDRVLLTINSAVIYLLYLAFEITLLLVNLRPNSEENG